MVDNHDGVRIADGAEPMRDHERRTTPRQIVQRCLHLGFVLIVERARRLVEQDHVGAAQHCTRDGEPLALAAREVRPTRLEHRQQLVRLLVDELPRLRVLAGLHDIALAHVTLDAVRQVGGDRLAEQDRRLVDNHNARTEKVHVILLDRHVVQQDRAALRLVEALQQRQAARLAAARRPNQRDLGAGLNGEREALQHRRAQIGGERKVYVAELDLATEARRPQLGREDGADREAERRGLEGAAVADGDVAKVARCDAHQLRASLGARRGIRR
mmetsp:Transcript_34438/g.102881  ORF Transcript_34438/g.102881 Transcript_34438/m.102881 type:complete len:272 (-) Transcript_34438:1769-2584(-)